MIVENVHLHILPSLNPDGFTARKRNNANNVDLNRDFPDQVTCLIVLFSFHIISSISLHARSNHECCDLHDGWFWLFIVTSYVWLA